MTLVTESELKIGVLSRRAPISRSKDSGVLVEHVGGLTRVLPILAEYLNFDWIALTTQSQIGLPDKNSYSEISDQIHKHQIDVYLAKVDNQELNECEWFCAQIVWPLLHDLPIPHIAGTDLDRYFEATQQVSAAMASKAGSAETYGFLVNDFQLSQVPRALRVLEPDKSIVFFLHTPWPKDFSGNSYAIKILKFLASGMLVADVIEFQTLADLNAFEGFVAKYLPEQSEAALLAVNPVSVNVQNLARQSQNSLDLGLSDDDISYVHIARSDPIKNTLNTIEAFAAHLEHMQVLNQRNILDVYVVPSRQQWPEYQDLLLRISNCVEFSNSKLSALGYAPIRLHLGNDYQRATQALIRYDYLIACSVADGLNLVVKEGAALNQRNGVIISSPKVGAMAELGSACVLSDDFDAASIAKALKLAVEINNSARFAMSLQLKAQVNEFDAQNWAKLVIEKFRILEKV